MHESTIRFGYDSELIIDLWLSDAKYHELTKYKPDKKSKFESEAFHALNLMGFPFGTNLKELCESRGTNRIAILDAHGCSIKGTPYYFDADRTPHNVQEWIDEHDYGKIYKFFGRHYAAIIIDSCIYHNDP